MEEGTIFASKPIVRKVESDREDSDLECYIKLAGNPLLVDIDTEVMEGRPAFTLLPNRLEEEEIKSNGHTMGGNGNYSVRRSHRTLKHSDRLGSEPYFQKNDSIFAEQIRKEAPKHRLKTMEEMDYVEDYNPNDDN